VDGVSRNVTVADRFGRKSSELLEIVRRGWVVLDNFGMDLALFCMVLAPVCRVGCSDLDGFVRCWTIVFGFGRHPDDSVRLVGGLDWVVGLHGVVGRGIVAAFGVAVRICSDSTRLRRVTNGRQCCRTDASECAGCGAVDRDFRSGSVDGPHLQRLAALWASAGHRAGARLRASG